MKTIPNQNQLVVWSQMLWFVDSVNLGGKCVLRPEKRSGGRKSVKDVDISELSSPAI